MNTIRYRKKPIPVDAVQWHGETNCADVFAFLGWDHPADETDHDVIYIPTLEGTLTAQPGDWILRGPRGEVWPVRGDIFAETYEPAVQPPADRAACVHPEGYDGECPCPASCGCCKVAPPADRAALRGRIAAAARAVPLRLGPNATAMAQRGEPIILNMSEADDLADAVLAVLPAPADRAAENSSGLEAEAELYVLLRKAGEDRYEAQALINRHRDEVLRRVAAEEQPATEEQQ